MPKIQGKIVAIGESGNLVTDIRAEQLTNAPRDDRVRIRCDEHETTGIFGADHDQPAATLIAILGQGGQLELVIVGDSAQLMLGVTVGEQVEVSW